MRTTGWGVILSVFLASCGATRNATDDADAGAPDAGTCGPRPTSPDLPDCPTDGCSYLHPFGTQCQTACTYGGCWQCTSSGDWQRQAWDCPAPPDAGS